MEIMVTNREFVALKKGNRPPRMSEIPQGGICLSAFIVLSKRKNKHLVLMGRLSKKAAWDHIGGLDEERVERNSKGWMLPSSHLMLGEGPLDAARRIMREQLGLVKQRIEGPRVFSEVYTPGRHWERHWDLEFVYLGVRETVPTHEAWSELRFVDLRHTGKEEIARSHEDILAHVGVWHR